MVEEDVTDDTGDGPQEDGSDGADETCRRRYRHKACHDSGCCAEHRCLTPGDGLDDRPGDDCACRCRKGVDHGQRSVTVRFQVRAGVEAEPANPEYRGSGHGQRHRVGRHIILAQANPLADQDTPDKTCDSGVDVDNRAAGEVQRAPN